ncbi:NUDIX domain-containing protein [Colletotrichum sojae]|uniref:NUDIX domain-containing protein n=1 Tax=Colletotrichum sojae TaxID=2175907 RepID=A0A8H6MQU7_9PEZI|nr:NUDIX domain-containing protein [Colletotrichum sojae]
MSHPQVPAPPSSSEDATAPPTTTTTTTKDTTTAPQQDGAPPTDQQVHEITAHVAAAAAAKHPPAATASPADAAAAATHRTETTTTAAAPPNGVVDAASLALSLDNQEEDFEEATSYWDAGAMAPLNAVSAPTMYLCANRMLMRSKAAIARLRRYAPPPFPLWDRLPVSRRAAVLILLYADRRGDLRVVITMRAASLRSFSGHAAFPGGKADTLQETPYEIARREAWEEIGLPVDDARIPKPFKIEPLCYLPYNLARTELVVRPCVAFLHADEAEDPAGDEEHPSPLVEERMIPRLDAKEVAAVFSAPFQNFLKAKDPEESDSNGRKKRPLPPGHWYDGSWIQWKEHPWRVHNFHVPVDDQRVTTPGNAMDSEHPQGNLAGKLENEVNAAGKTTDLAGNGSNTASGARFKVWGLTAHMLVDAARVAYGREPEFECNPHYGDEEIILQAEKEGTLLTEKKRKRDEVAAADGEGEREGEREREREREGRTEPAKM